MRRRLFLVPLTLACLASLASPAKADDAAKGAAPAASAPAAEPAKTDKSAAAEELFRQAIKLMKEGNFQEACPKLEASNKISWAPGTTINLADCYEQVGRLASAWAKYLEAEPHFRNRNPPDERADIAKQRADSLYSKLPKLDIQVPAEARSTGLAISRDGDPIDEREWGTGLPVDPGKHVVEVTAPGKKPWKWEADVGAGGGTVTVKVPVLKDAPAAPAGSATTADTGMPVQRKAAIGVGAAGVVGLALGGIFGGLTLGKVGEADATCTKTESGTFVCDAAGSALRDEAKGLSTISTVGFIAGGVLVAGGVVLWLTAPSAPAPSKEASARPRVWLAPSFGPTNAGLEAGGRF